MDLNTDVLRRALGRCMMCRADKPEQRQETRERIRTLLEEELGKYEPASEESDFIATVLGLCKWSCNGAYVGQRVEEKIHQYLKTKYKGKHPESVDDMVLGGEEEEEE